MHTYLSYAHKYLNNFLTLVILPKAVSHVAVLSLCPVVSLPGPRSSPVDKMSDELCLLWVLH